MRRSGPASLATLQYLGSILGAFLGFAAMRLAGRAPRWWASLAGAVLLAWAAPLAHYGQWWSAPGVRSLVLWSGLYAGMLWGSATFLLAAGLRLRRRRPPPPSG